MIRERIKLKFWQSGELLADIAGVADDFYDKLQGWLEKLSVTIDANTAPLQLLDLLAWQRDITRWADEPETLYRKRVKYALANAKDAGSKAGFERIWERIGNGDISQTERVDGQEWDIIFLEIDDNAAGDNMRVLDEIIRQYGRTCRRYALESNFEIICRVRAAEFGMETDNYIASA